MSTTKTVIIDSGRSKVKVLCGEDKPLAFPAVIAPGRDFNMPVKANDPLGALHLVISGGPKGFPSGEYFIGDLAVNQARAAATQKRDRDKGNENNLILILAAAAIHANQGEDLRLVANLPARDWAKQRDLLATKLKGRYRVEHRRGFLRGTIHDFNVAEVIVLPEGAAAYFGAGWGCRYGKPFVRNEALLRGTCRAIDVGDTTVNIITMRDQDYIDAECLTRDLGLHLANGQILTWAQNEFEGLELTLPELEGILRQEQPIYWHGTTKIDFTGQRAKAYSALAARIASEMQAALPGVTHHVLLAGGGCIALAEQLRAVFAGKSNVVYNAEEAQWLNVLGMQVMVGLRDTNAAA